jgi:hypothetical protein
MTYCSMGAITDIGASPYKISGDPVTALVAQLNRFVGKTVDAGCGGITPVPSAFPLVPAISNSAAQAAALILWQRYRCAPSDVWSKTKDDWASSALFSGGDPVPPAVTWSFVMNNLTEVTTTIAQFADTQGLAPADVGITQVDPKLTPKFPVGTAVIVGALAIGAYLLSRRA